jgi:hypothetical protein
MSKTFKFDINGTPPNSVMDIFEKFNNKEATREAIKQLDSDIEFVVCDLKEAHGNVNVYGKNAWMSPKNNDNSWNVNIKFN